MKEEELFELRKLAEDCQLEGRSLLCQAPEVVSRICNGIGPSWFPASLRLMIDAFHPSLKVVAAIHDLWYYYSKGDNEDFLAANRAFRENGVRVARHLYGWYNPRRYLVEFSAARFARLASVCIQPRTSFFLRLCAILLTYSILYSGFS